MGNSLNKEQSNGLEQLRSGANILLTGNAGTGKSYLINYWLDELYRDGKDVMVVAPTGVAALNIGGATIHRAFRAPTEPLIERPKSISKTLLCTDVLVCDEISMCRIDLFEFMLYQVMMANDKRRKDGMHDIQIVVVGDFFQLPPVITPQDRSILKQRYPNLGRGFCFKSGYWSICNFRPMILRESMRQCDAEYVKNLNYARVGDARCIEYFNDKSRADYDDGAIALVGKNIMASSINSQKIEGLPGRAERMLADVEGDVKQSDKVAPDVLDLKVGARVMTLVNSQDDSYNNGSLGTVKAIKNDRVKLEMDTGETVSIERNTWDIKSYSIKDNKLHSDIIGRYTQFPLKLAYAITIHKSQGQTYDRVNIEPACWDCGQLYVALSRCKDMEHLHMMRDAKESELKASREVINFYDSLRTY